MRKTQIALAAVALVASTAALADGVKISGTLEGAVANTTNNGTYLSTAGGWVAGNNIRFSGDQDLGGGMKAVFGLEAGTDLNGYANNGGATYGGHAGGTNGLTANSVRGSGLFSREASVGIASDAVGTIKIGRQLSPAVASYAGTGTLGNGHFFVNRLAGVGGGNVAGGGSLAYEGFWVDNAITYSTPSIGGFSINAMQQFKNASTNGAVPAGAADDAYTAAALNGAVDMINFSVSYEKRSNGTTTGLPTGFTNYGLNANTKFGAVSLAGSYHYNELQGSTGTALTGTRKIGSYSLEAGYNVTDPLMVMVQYAANDASTSGTLWALSGKYSLSKTSFIYLSYLDASAGVSSSFETRGETGAANTVRAIPTAAGSLSATSNRSTIVGIATSF
jgi:predicted porin